MKEHFSSEDQNNQRTAACLQCAWDRASELTADANEEKKKRRRKASSFDGKIITQNVFRSPRNFRWTLSTTMATNLLLLLLTISLLITSALAQVLQQQHHEQQIMPASEHHHNQSTDADFMRGFANSIRKIKIRDLLNHEPFELQFRTQCSGPANIMYSDNFVIRVNHEGKLEYEQKGGGRNDTRAYWDVTDGQWHTLLFNNSQIFLDESRQQSNIQNEDNLFGFDAEPAWLNFISYIDIGGGAQSAPSPDSSPDHGDRTISFFDGFVGCVRALDKSPPQHHHPKEPSSSGSAGTLEHLESLDPMEDYVEAWLEDDPGHGNNLTVLFQLFNNFAACSSPDLGHDLRDSFPCHDPSTFVYCEQCRGKCVQVSSGQDQQSTGNRNECECQKPGMTGKYCDMAPRALPDKTSTEPLLRQNYVTDNNTDQDFASTFNNNNNIETHNNNSVHTTAENNDVSRIQSSTEPPQVLQDECSPACINGGTCFLSNRTCACPTGFTGLSCEHVHPAEGAICDGPNSCRNGGKCIEGECYCKPGYTGILCEQDINECDSNPCNATHTSECRNLVNAFECVCLPGYTGPTCAQEIDECESNPCQNGATCVDKVAGYECQCVAGYDGIDCENNIDDCAVMDEEGFPPCKNGGVCHDRLLGYTCDCDDTGFTGQRCEINIDDCQHDKCQHNSTCLDKVKDYSCECLPGYEGKHCETDIDECANPLEEPACKENGTCYQYSDQRLYSRNAWPNRVQPEPFQHEFSFANAAGYYCACPPGFRGARCEENIDECSLKREPCNGHGICKDGRNEYTCECAKGYTGLTCDINIDECESNPCVRGTCEDGIGDYRCLCPPGYGSKNCEVELTACNDNPCENNGTCRAFYENSTHDFACTCPNGYVGKRCEIETTISFNNSYISVVENNSGLEEADKSKYELKFRFRTTLPNVVIAAGQGLTYFMLTLSDGRLNLQSSLLNSLQGISSGSNLANAEWHSVGISVNSTHIALTANSEQTIHPISENDETQGEGFNTTFLGGAPTTLVTLNRDNFGNFVGCMEDVEINGNSVNRVSITPDSRPGWNVSSPEPITFGCLRKPQCPGNNNPCVNNGVCTDLWNTYKCQCVRPYLGSRCVYSYWPATFGHENTTNSMARVDIFPEISTKFSNSFEISMFIRTRERKGTIFYLGDESRETGLFLEAAIEEDGGFVVLSKIDDANKEENYNVGGAIINDGYRHLVSIQREKGLVKISVNGTEHFRKSVKEKSQFSPVLMFIGGVSPGTDGIEYPYPEDATPFPGSEGNTGPPPPSAAHAVVRSFKGVIQDVRVNLSQSDHGPQKEGWYVVKFYDQVIPHAMGFPLGNVTLTSGVVKDQVSDDTCRVNPCKNGGVCNVTWNDFTCNCPQDIWSGKTCQVLLRCPQVKCPEGSECRNIGINGFQCVAPASFDGKTNLSPHYYLQSDEPSNLDFTTIGFKYRSRVGGSILDLASRLSNLRIAVERESTSRFDALNASGLITVYLNGSRMSTKIDNALDGEWHQVHLGIDSDRYLVLKFDGVSKGRITPRDHVLGQLHSPVPQRLITDIVLAPNATVVVGSHFLEGSEYYTDNEALSDSHTVHQPVSYDSFYRGCLSNIVIGDFELPFISQDLLRSTNQEASKNLSLVEKTAPTAFYIVQHSNTPAIGCVLCYDDECVHGSCANAKELYQCSCENGWDGYFCDHNIDECQNNLCASGSSCIDGIANYTCNCEDGYTGWLCNIDIDECKLYEPCQNGGVCRNYIPEDGKYHCECTPEWIGKNCTQRKHVSCKNSLEPCKQGRCVPIPETPDGLQFRCDCHTGYRGQLCEEEINYCYNQTCYNGGTCNNLPSYESTECMCVMGYNGPHCEINVDDCHVLGEPVCKNNATCIDGINEYTCDCAGTGFEGPNCDIDIDECLQRSVNDQCQRDHGKMCRNIPGHFECVCREPYCGDKCNIINPCSLRPSNETCMNGGFCRPVCPADEQPSYVCDCNEGFTGTMCHLRSTDRSQTMNIALIVVPVLTAFLLAAVIAIVVLVKMARKKRATRGVYSPSQEEYSNPRVELDNVLKPPPEERLI